MQDLISWTERRELMKETDGFLEATMASYRDAETALHNGDAAHARLCGRASIR
jgi:hypothetical protein